MKYLRWYILGVALLLAFISTRFKNWNRGQAGSLNWDVYGYSFYLSSAFIYNDIDKAAYLTHLDTLYRPCEDSIGYGRVVEPTTGNTVFKYTMGNAYFYAPFYLAAHQLTSWVAPQWADGYSRPYSMGLQVGWIVWAIVGLYGLGLFLLRYFAVWVVLLTLTAVAFGTNFYAYTIQTVGMNHIPLFCCNAWGLYWADTWCRTQRARYVVGMACMLALAVLTRPSELVLCVLPLAIPFVLHQRGLPVWATLWAARWQWLGAVVAGMVIIAPQLIYWHYTTGHLFYNAYKGEYFDLTNPRLIDGLFSYRKGFFTYAPIAWLSVVGWLMAVRRYPMLAGWWLLYMSLNCYVIFSWWMWTYGGGLGARSMIQSLVFWAVPMAYAIQQIGGFIGQLRASAMRRVAASLAMAGVLACIGLQMFQTTQYQQSVLHWNNMSKESYWFTFGRLSFSDAEKAQLQTMYAAVEHEDD